MAESGEQVRGIAAHSSILDRSAWVQRRAATAV